MTPYLSTSPQVMGTLSLLGFTLGAASLASGARWPGLLLWALGLFALGWLGRIAAQRRRFAAQLQEACRVLGEPQFHRPYSEGAGEALDKIAAALAARHGKLVREREERSRLERTLQAALAAVPDPCFVVNADGRVERHNPAARAAFELKPEQSIGRPLIESVRSHLIAEALADSLRNGSAKSLAVSLRMARGPVHYEVRIEPIAAGPNEISPGAIVLLRDVTRLRYLERVRKEFVANLAHELRTPITSVKGFVETLLDTELSEEARARFLDILKREADRLHALVNDLLDLSLLESETTPPRREPVDIPSLVANVFAMLEPQARSRRITFHFDAPSDLPAVPAHPGMLEQALVNLVDNAVKYSPEGEQVTVEARRVGGEHVEIAVVDRGPGIPSEHLGRLFERFYRVDKARSKSLGGTGLGLAIVRHVVSRHGGSVRAESRLGKGSRFIITLPLIPDDEAHVPDWND